MVSIMLEVRYRTRRNAGLAGDSGKRTVMSTSVSAATSDKDPGQANGDKEGERWASIQSNPNWQL